jgi:hypothetical protein
VSQGKRAERRSLEVPKQSTCEKQTNTSAGSVPIAQTEATAQPVLWRQATRADAAALNLLQFETEIASGQAVYFSDELFESGDVLVADVDGRIVGGMFFEEALVATFVGLDKKVAESAGKELIGKALLLAGRAGSQLVQVRFPRNVTLNLHTDEKIRTGRNTQ